MGTVWVVKEHLKRYRARSGRLCLEVKNFNMLDISVALRTSQWLSTLGKLRHKRTI